MSRAPRKPTELYARLYCNILRNAKAVERSDLGTLREGQKVSFELERGQQGKTSAVNLKAV